MYSYHELMRAAGLRNLPDALEARFDPSALDGGGELLRHGFLQDMLERFAVPADAARRLREALASVEANRPLLAASRFLVRAMCEMRPLCDADGFQAVEPDSLDAGRDCYPFLLLLACVEPSMERLRSRGVPGEYFSDIPFRPMKEQFRMLAETGGARVKDFPWDLNFYTCAIFQFDRFLFIPCRMEDPLRVFRSRSDGRAAALYKGGRAFRRDGQLNGANGLWDESGSFVSEYREEEDAYTGTYLDPAGYAVREPVRLLKAEWEPVFEENSGLLAVHVPSGPGYTPERLRNSMRLALAFYDRYLPEIDIRGFWSESWLYDPRLGLALNGKDCNILRVQRQMYLYPILNDGTMLDYELFHVERGGPLPRETSLQRAAAEWREAGGRFCTTSMFLLRGDAERSGEISTPEGRAAFERAARSF